MEDKGKNTRREKKGAESKVRIITSTKKGDRGETRLLSGEKVSKSDLRIEAGGNLDESNAIMGLAKTFTENERIRNIIVAIQGELILLGSELSSTDPRRITKRVELEHISQLEKWISELQEEVPLSPRFVSPGVNSVSAALDMARSVIRRTERSMVMLQEIGQLERAETLKYVNRLGCLLYTLARYAEKVK